MNGIAKIFSISFPAIVRVMKTGTMLPQNEFLTATLVKEEKGECYFWIKEFNQWHSSSIFSIYIFTTPN